MGVILSGAGLMVGDTITKVGPPVTMGITGPKILETRQLRSAIRSQTDNYPNEWKGQSASSGGHPGRDQRWFLGNSTPTGQAEQPTKVLLSLSHQKNQHWVTRKLDEWTHLAAITLVPMYNGNLVDNGKHPHR